MGRDKTFDEATTQAITVSIHAPAWGATVDIIKNLMLNYAFQSTRPHGARQIVTIVFSLDKLFQSTRPHGARPRQSGQTAEGIRFQSTRPHGARPGSGVVFREGCCFNPRARMGRDEPVSFTIFLTRQFQSTRPHGARRYDPEEIGYNVLVSIHAPAWGAT